MFYIISSALVRPQKIKIYQNLSKHLSIRIVDEMRADPILNLIRRGALILKKYILVFIFIKILLYFYLNWTYIKVLKYMSKYKDFNIKLTYIFYIY